MTDIPELTINAERWVCANDVYDALFAAVRAPSWHGRNLDALHDSIGTGEINGIELPYRLIVCNASKAAPDALKLLSRLVELIGHLKNEGCPVEIELVD